MNAIERRQLIKARVIEVAVAKTALNQSRRRAESARTLRNALAAQKGTVTRGETIAYPQQPVG